MTVAIIGTVAFDSIETPRGVHNRILGGSATYAGVAASLFSPVHLISIVGSDFPQVHFDYLEKRGISTDGIIRSSGLTFHWKGFYKGDMSQAHTLQTDLNVLLEFDPKVPASAADSRIVFLVGFDLKTQQFDPRCFIHHLPNNYVNRVTPDGKLGTIQIDEVIVMPHQETPIKNLLRRITKKIMV